MTQNAYDEVPYPVYSHQHTHPTRLAAMAALQGFITPDPAACRVLELGCAAGGNIIPMAVDLPGSQFVGIDRSQAQVSAGKKKSKKCGVGNIELLQADIEQLPADLGIFDYIICHGVFSWVPEAMQSTIMEVCDKHLSQQGIALISYNTLPGWQSVGTVRELMLFHTRGLTDPEEKVRESRQILKGITDSFNTANANPLHAAVYQHEERLLRHKSNNYLLHDHLELDNHPVYFHQFATLAEKHGLRYVGDTAPSKPKARDTLQAFLASMGDREFDRLETEQLEDFLFNTRFRRSILTHANNKAARISPKHLFSVLHLASPLKPSSDPSFLSSPLGVEIHINNPILLAMLEQLTASWPNTMTISELLDGRSFDALKQEEQVAVDHLLHLCREGALQMHATPLRIGHAGVEKPLLRKLNRYEASLGGSLTSLHHNSVDLNSLQRLIASKLDGTKDREQILKLLLTALERKEIRINDTNGKSLAEPATAPLLEKIIEETLATLEEKCLLYPGTKPGSETPTKS